jgi:hypothetical protein
MPNNSFKAVAKIKYLGIMVINKNYVHEEIVSILNLDRMVATIKSRQNIFVFHFLCKNVQIKIYKEYFCHSFPMKNCKG